MSSVWIERQSASRSSSERSGFITPSSLDDQELEAELLRDKGGGVRLEREAVHEGGADKESSSFQSIS